MKPTVPRRDVLTWPFVVHRSVFHLGTMDPSHKGKTHNATSYEGNGLSVSIHPDEWRQIAKLGGNDLWQLELPGGLRFLDAHALTDPHRERVMSWAKAAGLVRETSIIEVSWYDSELEDRLGTQYNGDDPIQAAKAKEEYEYLLEEDPDSGDEGPKIKTLPGFAPAVAMHERIGFKVDIGFVRDLALTLYVEDVLASADASIHGVWWNDRLDPSALSAPRGVVLPKVVPQCAKTLAAPAETLGGARRHSRSRRP
jgi:hypothetical protein